MHRFHSKSATCAEDQLKHVLINYPPAQDYHNQPQTEILLPCAQFQHFELPVGGRNSKKCYNSVFFLASSKCVIPILQKSCHICMRLDAVKEIFVKVMNNQLGFTMFLSNFVNFPGGCEKAL